MAIDTWLLGINAVGEFLIAFVIYREWEGNRLDHFLEDVDSKEAADGRKTIYTEYCGLLPTKEKTQRQLFKEKLETPDNVTLREICRKDIRLLSRIGARRPTKWFSSKNVALDWHVVVLLWEMLGLYVEERREEAGPTYAKPFLEYARASADQLLKQDRNTWTIRDPDLRRKQNVILTRERLEEMEEELGKSLEREG
jgi:hypothetical protein